ncbi:MAG: hypothetical protein WCJ01_01640 [Ignavibacteria bacterium]
METKEKPTYNQAEVNAANIEAEIAKLKENYWNDISKRNSNDFWEHAHFVVNMFKILRPILPEDRDRLWQEFEELRYQSKQYGQLYWEKRRSESTQKRTEIETVIQNLHNNLIEIKDAGELNTIKNNLNKIIDMIKSVSTLMIDGLSVKDPADGNNDCMLRSDKDYCWKLWRKINDEYREKKSLFDESSFLELKSTALEILKQAESSNPHKALNALKVLQSNQDIYKLGKTYREELKLILNESFDKAIKRIKQINEENKKRHLDWVNKIQSNLSRWNELKIKNEGIISSLEAQITKLEEDIVNSQTPEYSKKVQVWIEEKTIKISDIKKTNHNLDEKIDSAMKSLGT